ncbi:hypothetical protein H312_00180 [Anncaliia algerae PRA339]|uniref:MSP domain-containing protein n=1 Tax=Anncaliia algerae PRA339 TaxID=1288291 RepID=A0A059F5Y3_9MICR|nr:hypothetical protein H312_00180 [Anncaliia algerae PRA339]
MGEEILIDPESTISIDPVSRRGEIVMNNQGMVGKGYKIKTTKPDDYTVKPNIGIIHPLQKSVIEIIVQPKTKISSEHKFLIEVYNFDWRRGAEKFKEFLKETKEPPIIKRMLSIKLNEPIIKEFNFKSKKVYEIVCLVIIFIQFLLLVYKMLS